MLDRRSLLVCIFSLIGSLAISYGFSEPFQKRRAKQRQLKSLGAFAVAFDVNGSVSSARFRDSIAPGFLKHAVSLRSSTSKGLSEFVRISKSLRV